MYFKPRYLSNIEWELYVFSQLVPNGDCLEWSGFINKRGYGSVTRNKKPLVLHRLIYKLVKGKIPKGKVLDHLCRNTKCANPEHLEPVTDRVNVLRGVGLAAQYARRDSCKHGHKFTKENTLYSSSNNARRCRTCKRNETALRRQRLKYV